MPIKIYLCPFDSHRKETVLNGCGRWKSETLFPIKWLEYYIAHLACENDTLTSIQILITSFITARQATGNKVSLQLTCGLRNVIKDTSVSRHIHPKKEGLTREYIFYSYMCQNLKSTNTNFIFTLTMTSTFSFVSTLTAFNLVKSKKLKK